MLDTIDSSKSTLRLILWNALQKFTTSQLIELLSDADPIVRTSAAKQLQLRSDDEVFNEVARHSTGGKAEDREVAAYILGQFGTPSLKYKERSIPILRRLASDHSDDVRAIAIDSLGRLKAHECIGEILRGANDKSPEVREATAIALGNVGDDSVSVPILSKLSNDAERRVREWAKHSLAARTQAND